MTSLGRGPLWTCPKCGAKLVTRNLWHSCRRATMKQWYRRMGPRARRLFERFERLVAACGEYDVAPAKTRIAFMGRVRFAGITNLSEEGMTCTFAMPYPLRSKRFVRVEEVAPGWWGHRDSKACIPQPNPVQGRVVRMPYSAGQRAPVWQAPLRRPAKPVVSL